MARAVLSTEPSRVYVGMLVITCLAMLVGITVMVLEGGEYDWVQKPPASPDVKTLLKDLNAPPKADGSAAAVEEPAKVVEAPKPVLPEPAMPPLPKMESPSARPVTVAEAPKPAANPVEPAPLAVPSGPIPSPLIIPGR